MSTNLEKLFTGRSQYWEEVIFERVTRIGAGAFFVEMMVMSRGLACGWGGGCCPRMAIFGSLATVRAQLAHAAHFQAAFAYLDDVFAPGSAVKARILAVPAGKTERVELSGGAFALEQTYLSKARPQGFFESHLAYIDVQVIVAGEELMEVAEVARLTVSENLTPAKDLLKYQMFDSASVLRVGAGGVAVFFPVDGHMPSLAVTAPALVHKTVVKVPVIG